MSRSNTSEPAPSADKMLELMRGLDHRLGEVFPIGEETVGGPAEAPPIFLFSDDRERLTNARDRAASVIESWSGRDWKSL